MKERIDYELDALYDRERRYGEFLMAVINGLKKIKDQIDAHNRAMELAEEYGYPYLSVNDIIEDLDDEATIKKLQEA